MSVSAINACDNHHLSPVILQQQKRKKLIWTTALRNRKQIVRYKESTLQSL